MCHVLVVDELKTVTCLLNVCDIVFQTWSFKMPKHKNVHFCQGIIPKYGYIS